MCRSSYNLGASNSWKPMGLPGLSWDFFALCNTYIYIIHNFSHQLQVGLPHSCIGLEVLKKHTDGLRQDARWPSRYLSQIPDTSVFLSAGRVTCRIYACFLTNQHGLACVKWWLREAECSVTRIKILSSEQETDKRQAGWGFSGRDRACYRETDIKFSRLWMLLGSASSLRQTGEKAKVWEAKKAKWLTWFEHAAAQKSVVTTCVLNCACPKGFIMTEFW
jgi:hypothetical protein